MATGIGNLPYVMPDVSPFDVITAQETNERIANIEALADGSGIGDEAITNTKLKTGSGQPGGAWTSYTPTFTNFTIGNGTLVAAYKQVGKIIYARIRFIMGSTSVYGSVPTFTAPVAAASYYATGNNFIGVGYAEDAGNSASNVGFQFGSSSTVITIVAMKTDGMYGSWVGSAGNAPFNWGTGDYFSGEFVYEAA